jgi:hypothetical protein
MPAKSFLRIALFLLLLTFLATLPLTTKQLLYLAEQSGICFFPGIIRVPFGLFLVEIVLLTSLKKRNWIDQSVQLTNDVWVVFLSVRAKARASPELEKFCARLRENWTHRT